MEKNINKNVLAMACKKGLPIAGGAWVLYAVIRSFFDDTVLEQLFKPAGLIFAIVAAAVGVGFFYNKLTRKEQQAA